MLQANRIETAADIRYLNNIAFTKYCDYLAAEHPDVFSKIDPARIRYRELIHYIEKMNAISWEFESHETGGRGRSYNKAQKNSDNRMLGTLNLLRQFSKNFSTLPTHGFFILDALAGDGTITRMLQQKRLTGPTIISADISQLMVGECLSQGFPCIRQSASQSLFRDECLDGVLIAYGAHHLNDKERDRAIAEAFRTLRKGRRMVLHDFEIGEPAAKWFEKVVDPFSRTGHPQTHFTRDEMFLRTKNGGFRDVRIYNIDDPFTIRGKSADEAMDNIIMHMYDMYDLVKIKAEGLELKNIVRNHIEEIFGEIEVTAQDEHYVAVINRQALVAVATKT